VLWARLVSKRVYGYSGRDSYDLYDTDGVFTGALSDELGWKYSGLKSGHTQGRAYGFSIIILLYGWFLALALGICSGDEHLWVGEVCGGDFIPWSRGSVM
jgi:hypothetical protein